MRSRTAKPYCSATKRFNMSDSMRRSSVWSKFMPVVSLQSEDHLRDDVLLDFIRAAEDRQLAVVEVLSGGAVGAGRADARAGIAVCQGLRHVGARRSEEHTSELQSQM